VSDLAEKIVALEGETAPVPVASAESEDDPANAVRSMLSDFHLAASEADEAHYFDHLADDVV
jgi:hypothetical protein